MATPHLSRRRFLGGASLGLAAAAFGGPLLSACSSSPSAGGAAGPAVSLPTYVPFEGPTPDLAGDVLKGINPGYFQYPIDRLVKTVDGEVGSGGELSAFVVSFSPPPPGVSQNAYWQAINESLNVDFKPTLVPEDFATKLAAILTGGDIPDLVTMYKSDANGLRRFEDLARERFADLSDHLSGDAVKDYPNLARLPEDSWPLTLIGGRIYATPTLRIPTGSVGFFQPSVLDKYGANPNPRTPDEFEEMCKAFTDPGANRYALAGAPSAGGAPGWMAGSIFHPMFGVPYDWRLEDDGALTKDFETEEWTEAVAYVKKLWDGGYFHPDSPSEGFDADPLFTNGSVALRQDSIVRYAVRNDDGLKPDIMPVYGPDGTPTAYEGARTDFVTYIKKADDERVQECLRVLNWLSAPYGSEENYLRSYGVEGVDHTVEAGQPVITARGEAEVNPLCLRFIAGGPDVLSSSSNDRRLVEQMHQFQSEVSASRVKDPTEGLYSEAAIAGASEAQKVYDVQNDVILGRKDLSELGDVVASWRKSVGDKIRDEYLKGIEEREMVS
ncbi:sugar ABC transporter substrate-binding protein [Isoptericola hypogeus]|uniref:Sugar ABC transporter substrate-binding protein n=1 Tax=Isoptericola hypogeus TaxID=300179 RepID=A0ABN2JJ16_9MICO